MAPADNVDVSANHNTSGTTSTAYKRATCHWRQFGPLLGAISKHFRFTHVVIAIVTAKDIDVTGHHRNCWCTPRMNQIRNGALRQPYTCFWIKNAARFLALLNFVASLSTYNQHLVLVDCSTGKDAVRSGFTGPCVCTFLQRIAHNCPLDPRH